MGLFKMKFVLLATLFVTCAADSAEIPSSVFCQAALEAGKNKSDLNPLTSLRDVRYRLSKLPIARETRHSSPYMGSNLKLDLEDPRWRPFQRVEVEAALARLAQLEEHATQINFDGTYVGFELRGSESVQKARATVLNEINKYEPQVHAELKRRYPYLRAANLIQHGISAFLLGALAYLISDPNYVNSALLMSPMVGTAVVSNELLLPYLRKSSVSLDFDTQLKTIDKTLAEPGAGTPLHIVSGRLEIRTELHKIFMTNMSRDLNDDEVHLLVDAAEKMHEKYGDDQWISRDWQKKTAGLTFRQKYEALVDQAMNEARYFPEGRTRQAYFDSIFYFDRETDEPVWLIFYRAFKTRPIPPKPPKKKKLTEGQTAPEESWVPGLRPQWVPAR